MTQTTTRSLHRLTLVILIGFFIVALSQAYWGVINADSMTAREDNPRLVEAERALMRGAIYDRTGQLLVESTPNGMSPSGKPLVMRHYLFPESASAIGYYSLVHGVGGIEATFDKQ